MPTAKLCTACRCVRKLEIPRIFQAIAIPIDPCVDLGYKGYETDLFSGNNYKQRIFHLVGRNEEDELVYQETFSP